MPRLQELPLVQALLEGWREVFGVQKARFNREVGQMKRPGDRFGLIVARNPIGHLLQKGLSVFGDQKFAVNANIRRDTDDGTLQVAVGVP